MRFINVKYMLATLILVASVVGSVVPQLVNAAAANLVANPGFETTTDGSSPDNWTRDSWGTNNASFTYVATAHTGTHAVQTTIGNYTDGDAKWMSDPLSVTAGTQYIYDDWYESTTSTNLWAQYTLNDGSYQYQFLKAVPAQSAWTDATATVLAPANAAKLRIFHVLATVGSLTLDDVSLTSPATPPATCSPSYANGLANGDFEDRCTTAVGLPAGWTGTSYGSSTAAYAISHTSYTGSNAFEIGNQTEGAEVGITTNVLSPSVGQRYSLSFAQHGSTYIYAYVAYGLKDGSTQYQSLMSAPATLGAWSQYSDEFVTPATTTSLAITIATSGSGTVSVDSVALTPLSNQVPTSFQKGLVSVTFDDGDASTYTNGFSVMKTNDFKGTYYLNAGSLNTSGFMTDAQVKALAANGQEIGSHLYHHSDMVQLDMATIQSEQTGNIAAIQGILGSSYNVTSFASPYGSYTSGDIDTVMQYAGSHRNTDGQVNTKANLNPRQIHARLVGPSTTASQIKTMATDALRSHTWLVLVYHNIASSTASEPDGEAGFTVTPSQFKTQMTAIKNSGVTVLPVASALAQLEAQE